jgi:DNA-directed RNA polymerase subunit RPC12/RpoP
MASKYYKCIKCGNGVTTSSHPLVGKCSKGGGHEWVEDDRKPHRWKCTRCGNGFAGSSHPLVGGCRKGEHEWVQE